MLEIFDKILKDKVGRVAVAVSGGADSMCLTYLAQEWCYKNKCKLYALIVDHGLRKESGHEAKLVKDYLEDHNINTHILPWQGVKPKSNIHKIAREARYKLLIEFCKNNNIEYLLTAHTKDDQAETVLLRIYRGSGVDGIAGIPLNTSQQGVTILRPLIEVNRYEIEALLKKVGWWWVSDPSNQNLKFDRVKARKILKVIEDTFGNKHFTNRLLLLADNAKRVRHFLERTTDDYLNKNVKFSELGYAEVSKDLFENIDEEIALRVLVKVLCKIGGNPYSPRLESTQVLLRSLRSPNFKGKTLWGSEVIPYEDKIIFCREMRSIPKQTLLLPHQELMWDNRYKVSSTRKLIIKPLTKEGLQILRALNFEVNLKTPSIKIIYTLPSFYDENMNLIAVPHLNYGKGVLKI